MEALALFIPIIAILTIGTVIVAYFYFTNREKQMIIEKGYTAEEIQNLFKTKKQSSYFLMGFGIISIFFGVSVSLGIMLDEVYNAEFLAPLCIFSITGAGMIVAHREREKFLAKRKLEERAE